jgi:hypothetical protein
MAAHIVEAFETALRNDPAVLFADAKKVDPSPAQGQDEDDDAYHYRLMLAAYSGTYLIAGRFPEPLKILQGGPKKYFTNAVDGCVNDRIKAALKQYALRIDGDRMKEILGSLELTDSLRDAGQITQVIQTLVSDPKIAVQTLLQQIQFSKKAYDRNRDVFDPLIREYAKERAKQICKVFDEEWYQPWRMREAEWSVFQSRFVEQQSLADGSKGLGLSSYLYNTLCVGIMAKFPGLRWAAARPYMAHTKEK